eukprot:CAMPEP_0201194608 /NCGR_PEP_ID=MMETSP0851-20130426/149507_1 /ASSEMBLY_ACC=CAM_ASM_000631 /TAXON_ID=183588 /ORGANISM="Pseudo-nitzschia fraudulenta, Strain WWA7" /LENGTH=362 /DNA_ID=CAMNT_0047481309 /DNA_START=27 /DNA_END=1115 /DNA_ORIENTATION=+
MAHAESEERTPKELSRYILIVSYDGTRYSGFQRQSSSSSSASNDLTIEADRKNLKRRRLNNQNKKKIKNRGAVPTTVQETLEDAIEFYTGLDRIKLQARFAGRTDGGVHARGQVVVVSLPPMTIVELEATPSDVSNVDAEEEQLWKIRKSINSRLPNDISIEDVSLCHDEDFDPRADAKSKQYSYTVRYRELVTVAPSAVGVRINAANGKQIHAICAKGGPHLLRTALDSNRVWICPWALDDSKLKQNCELLVGTHDYSAFVHKAARKTRNNQMTVDRLDYTRVKFRDEKVPIWEVRFLVEAKGFGRSQVRNMVGFLVDVCRGLFKDQELALDWLWKDDPDKLAKQINSAPACGLCLERVIY